MARDLVDVGTEFGARATRRLREDGIAWLNTLATDGTPQPNPVWFIWNGESALIYSVPGQAKVKNIERNPKVALHLDSQNSGDDIVILTGKAEIDPTAPPLDRNDAYVGKYRDDIKRIGFAKAADMARKYSVPIRFTPERVRGF